VMVVNLAIMVIMFFLTIVLTGNPVHGSLFQAIQLILVETLLVTAMAMFFSTFSSPTLSAIMTIGFYLIGHLTTDLKGIAEKSKSPVSEVIMSGLYYVCPNLEWLNIKGQAARGVMMGGEYQLAATAYGLIYASLLLFGACRIFERRDF
jgi:Cu-processing system permease protein